MGTITPKKWSLTRQQRARRNVRAFQTALDALAKGAQVVAVAIAGLWAYYTYMSTGSAEKMAEVTVSTEVIPYDSDRRLLVAHVRERNVGKVPITFPKDAMHVSLSEIPIHLSPAESPIKLDHLPVSQEAEGVFRRYGSVEIDPAVEFEDLVAFVVSPGIYHVEADLDTPDGDFVNGEAIARVQ